MITPHKDATHPIPTQSTYTVWVKFEDRPNICYIFEKVMVQGHYSTRALRHQRRIKRIKEETKKNSKIRKISDVVFTSN